jgi:putative FmdB family regulatory protein
MPFYEYQCKNCGHALEAMQKVSDGPLRKCPECGKSALQRLMSAPVFRLKGGGWYETDFKSEQDGKRNLADRPEDAAPKEEKKETKEEGAKEAPAAKDDAKEPAKPAEKAADKAEAPAKSPAKPASSRVSKRGSTKRSSTKRAAAKPTKRPAPKPKRRR